MRAKRSGGRQAAQTRKDPMSEESRLRWQCRRGMRELDDLLIRFLDTRYARADDGQKAAFRAVLELPDPELNGYLLQRQTPSSDSIARVIKLILSLPHT